MVIVSYQFAAKLEAEMRAIPWDLVVIDEAHKLRDALIDQLEKRLQQNTETVTLFTLRFKIV